MIVAPCGWGKGTVISWMIARSVARGKRVQFWVNRRTLVADMSKRLDRLGIDHGIIMADHPRRKPWLRVHIASIDTLHRRPHVPPADLLIFDECHFCISPMWAETLEKYPGVPVIGATATPRRMSGEGLGRIFNWMELGPSTAEATEMGLLVPTRIFAPPGPDVQGVSVSAGEFNQKQLGERADKPQLVGDIVDHWVRLGRGLESVCFAVNIQHSRHIVEKFTAAGFRWKHVDNKTLDRERDQTWDDLRQKRIDGVSSVGVISYGWDHPTAACGILARPTMSLVLFLQQVGRLKRTAPGKPNSLILDHAGNTLRHGMPDDPQEWTLDDAAVKQRDSKDNPALAVRMCRKCWFAFSSRLTVCPECGWTYLPDPRDIRHVDGELQEVKPEHWYYCEGCRHKGRLPDGATLAGYNCPRCQTGPLVAMASKYDTPDQGRRIAKLKEWTREAQERGYKRGYAAMKFRTLYGAWPRREWLEEQPQEATA